MKMTILPMKMKNPEPTIMMICRWEIIAQRMTFPIISFRRTTVLREKLPKRSLFRTVFHFTKR